MRHDRARGGYFAEKPGQSLVGVLLLSLALSAYSQTLFIDDFESAPAPVELLPRIEFISDQVALFSASGQQAAFEVRVFDVDGQVIPDAQVSWSSADPAGAAVTAIGPRSAEVEALSNWSGPIVITVDYVPLGISAEAQAVMATPAPETVLISSSRVTAISGNRGAQHQIILERTPETEQLQIDDILVTGDRAGVLVRVVAVQLEADRVIVQGAPIAITDAFQDLDLSVTGEPLRVEVRLDRRQAVVTVRSLRDRVLLKRRVLPRLSIDDLECRGGLSVEDELDISVLTLTRELIPRFGLRLEDRQVIDWLLLLEGRAGVDVGLDLALNTETAVFGECSVELPAIKLPLVPLYVFTLGPVLAPELGLKLDVGADAEADITTPGLSRHWSFRSGFRYTRDAGWQGIGEVDYEGESSGGEVTSPSGLQLEVSSFGRLSTSIGFNLGTPPLGVELARASFFELEGGPFWRFDIDPPLDPSRAAYTGPIVTNGVDAVAGVTLRADLFEGTLGKYLPLSLETSLDFPLFSDQAVFYRSVRPTLGIACTPDCNQLPTDGSGTVTLTAEADTVATGTVEFWASRDGADSLIQLAEASFANGQALASIKPDAATEPGTYTVYARLKMNGAYLLIHPWSQIWPYAGSESVVFTVGADTEPASFVFRKITDTTSFAVRDGDDIAFYSDDSIYKITGLGLPTLVADTQTTMPGKIYKFTHVGSRFDISNGEVVFSGSNYDNNYWGVFKSNGTSLTTLFDSETPIPGNEDRNFSSVGDLVFNNGKLTFLGLYYIHPSGGWSPLGIFIYDDVTGIITNLADPKNPPAVIGGSRADYRYPPLVENNAVVFHAKRLEPYSEYYFIYLYRNGEFFKVVDGDTPIPPDVTENFVCVRSPVFNFQSVLFLGKFNECTAGSISPIGIYEYNNGSVTKLYDRYTTPVPGRTINFSGFQEIAAGQGAIVFEGVFSEYPNRGLYTTLPGNLAKILECGDMLDGKRIEHFSLGRDPIDNQSIVFGVQFAKDPDGITRKAIYRADLVP